MGKHFFSPEGAARLYKELRLLDNEQLRQEALLLFDDALGWVAGRFELTVDQLEFLRGINPGFILSLGAGLSSAMLSRCPFFLEGTELLTAENVPKLQVAIKNGITSGYRYNNDALEAKGAVTMTFSLYKESTEKL